MFLRTKLRIIKLMKEKDDKIKTIHNKILKKQ